MNFCLPGAIQSEQGRSSIRRALDLAGKFARAFALFFCLALFAGCQTGPPREHRNFRRPDLVEITNLDAAIRLDIRYATSNNFLHRPVYKQARAFLQRPAAEAVVRANRALKPKGYGLMIFDGYQPWDITKLFWDSASDYERKIQFVANPKRGSRHNRGCAVDLTLYDLQTGNEVPMPSEYDEFSERAFPTYQGGTAEGDRKSVV